MTHKTVQEAMVAILSELPAIGKNQKAPAVMGGYSFRGIDDVLNALNPLLAKHGVFYVPTVRERIDGQFQNAKGNITWTVKLLVEYTFYALGPENWMSATVWGEAHDSGDKATQKALTAAQKSMLFQVFAINTADQADSDSERHETEEARPATLSGATVASFLAKCAEHGLTPKDIDDIVYEATYGRTKDVIEVHADELDELRKVFAAFIAVPEPFAGEDKVKPGKKVAKGDSLANTSGVENVETGTLV